jgi:two-component system, NtrC family, sensor kinase
MHVYNSPTMRHLMYTNHVVAKTPPMQTFLAYAPIAMAMLDKQLNYLFTSQQWRERWGWNEADLADTSYTNSVFHHSDEWQQIYQQCLTQGTEICREEFAHTSPTTTGWLKWQVTPWREPDNTIGGLIVIREDITTQKRIAAEHCNLEQHDRDSMAAALTESEEKFRRLVESANDLTYMIGLDGHFTYLSPQFRDMWGYELADFEDKSFAEIVHPEDMPRVVEATQNLMQYRQRDAGLEFRTRRKDGSWCWIVCNSAPIIDANDNLMGLQGIARDVSDRKLTEAALEASEARSRAILSALPDMMFCLDADGVFIDFFPSIDWDPVVLPDVFLGKQIADVLPTDVATHIFAALERALETAEVQIIEYQLELKGELQDYEARLVAYQDNRVLQMVRNISDRKQADLQLRQSEAQLRQKATELEQTLKELQLAQSQLIQSEKMSSLGQLVAGVAHEINNPVNFIHGNVAHANEYVQELIGLIQLYQAHYPSPVAAIQTAIEQIDLEFLTEDTHKLFSSMKVGTDRIRQIVLSLRTFSRMDEADLKVVDLHEGMDSTLMILEHRIKAKGDRPAIQIIKAYGDLPLVGCFAGQINQVFMNILTNAIDALEDAQEIATEPFTPTITITTQQIGTNRIAIYMRDNGPGIPEALKTRLFDPFFTTKPVGKGTGMGLSISYQIVTERHGGSLQCHSAPGQGAEFIISIPISQA